MNENKEYKLITVLVLLIGVVILTVGYSAFSGQLEITSGAEVIPSGNDFDVNFSSSSLSVQTSEIVPTLSTTAEGFSATNGVIDNTSDPVISNLYATFTEPGQSVTYNFYSYNSGVYVAYLNSITFTGSKVCTARPGTTQSMVNSACSGINLSIKVGSENYTTTSVSSIDGHTLSADGKELVTVVISYASGSAQADGAFDVTLPFIRLNYSSVD